MHRVDLDTLVVAEQHRRATLFRVVAADCDTRVDVDAALFERPQDDVRDLWSQPGRIVGSASSIVTCEPRSDIIEANSHPIGAAADHGDRLRQ